MSSDDVDPVVSRLAEHAIAQFRIGVERSQVIRELEEMGATSEMADFIATRAEPAAEKVNERVGQLQGASLTEQVNVLGDAGVRSLSLKWFLVGLAAAVLGGLAAVVLPHVLRVPAAMVGGLGLVLSCVCSVGLVLGRKSGVFLDMLFGNVKPLGCLVTALLLTVVLAPLGLLLIWAATRESTENTR